MVLVFLISNFFTNKNSQVRKLSLFSCSNSALWSMKTPTYSKGLNICFDADKNSSLFFQSYHFVGITTNICLVLFSQGFNSLLRFKFRFLVCTLNSSKKNEQKTDKRYFKSSQDIVFCSFLEEIQKLLYRLLTDLYLIRQATTKQWNSLK